MLFWETNMMILLKNEDLKMIYSLKNYKINKAFNSLSINAEITILFTAPFNYKLQVIEVIDSNCNHKTFY